MTPLISVIVPVYKVEKVLHYCIESILQQTYKNFELLLIDDGSPDKSGEICDSYAEKDERIKVIHKKNEGVSVARNTGFDNAKGEYIVCVDSDDYVNECYLQDFIDVVNEYPEAQMVWCGFSTVKDYEKTVIENIQYDTSGEKIIITDVSDIMTLHGKWLDASPCNKLYLKRFIKSEKLYMDKSLSLGEDLLFNFKYMDICDDNQIYIINKCTYYYVRSEKESLDNKFRPDMFEIYKHINDELLRYITNWNVDDEQKNIFYISAYYSYEKCLINTFNKNNLASKREKYRANKEILKSDRFKTAVKYMENRIKLPIRIAYRLNSYKLVKMINDVVRLWCDLKNKKL